MADATTVEVEADEAEAETETKTRSQMDKHQGFVDWYAEFYEGDLDEADAATVIAEFARLRNDFRRSEFYQSKWGEEAREAARAAREEAREAAKAAREAKRAAEAEARAKAKAEKEAAEGNGSGETKTKAKPKRRVAKKAAPSTIEVDETDVGEDASEDDVFE